MKIFAVCAVFKLAIRILERIAFAEYQKRRWKKDVWSNVFTVDVAAVLDNILAIDFIHEYLLYSIQIIIFHSLYNGIESIFTAFFIQDYVSMKLMVTVNYRTG